MKYLEKEGQLFTWNKFDYLLKWFFRTFGLKGSKCTFYEFKVFDVVIKDCYAGIQKEEDINPLLPNGTIYSRIVKISFLK